MNSAPDVRVVMIATPGEYQEMASLTAPRAEKVIGKPVEVLSLPAGADAFREKLRLLRGATKPVLYIDADMVFFHGWNWSDFRLNKFNAAHDYPLANWAPELSEYFNLNKAINAGMWLSHPKHLPVFEMAEELMDRVFKDHPARLGDQTALNRALFLKKVRVNLLPRKYNYQSSPEKSVFADPRTVVLHVVGNSVEYPNGNSKRKLERVQEALTKYPLKETTA